MSDEKPTGAELQKIQQEARVAALDDDKISLLKRTICKGATDDEFELFVLRCKQTGLDPFTYLDMDIGDSGGKRVADNGFPFRVGVDFPYGLQLGS